MEFAIVLGLIAWVVGFGAAAASLARNLDRPVFAWLGFGAVLGPIAWLILQTAPPGHCRTCGTPTRGWLRVCGWCGENVADTPVATLAIVDRMTATDRVGAVRSAAIPESLEHVTEPPDLRGIVSARPAEAVLTIADVAARRASRSAADAAPTHRVQPGAEPPDEPPLEAPSGTADSQADPGLSPPVAPRAPRRPHLVTQPIIDEQGRLHPVSSLPRMASLNGTRPQVDGGEGVLATAVYVAGSGQLDPGRRYGLAVRGTRLKVLGPVEVDPDKVVMDVPIEVCDASVVEGRLVVSGTHGRSTFVLAFMSVAGPGTDQVVGSIRNAAGRVPQA